MSSEDNAKQVIELEGEIDLHETPRVKEWLAEAIAKKPKMLILDLSKVDYIDSSGLAAFIGGLQKMSTFGGVLALTGIHDNVRTIFQISKLDKVFAIYPDVASALKA